MWSWWEVTMVKLAVTSNHGEVGCDKWPWWTSWRQWQKYGDCRTVFFTNNELFTMIAYSYNDPRSNPKSHPPQPPNASNSPPAYASHNAIPSTPPVTILFSCPSLSSCSWFLKLYTSVCGGMGAILSGLFVVGHGYVLCQTEDTDLRTQRWTQNNRKHKQKTNLKWKVLHKRKTPQTGI